VKRGSKNQLPPEQHPPLTGGGGGEDNVSNRVGCNACEGVGEEGLEWELISPFWLSKLCACASVKVCIVFAHRDDDFLREDLRAISTDG